MDKLHSYQQFKTQILINQESDRMFYEMMMEFSSKVLQTAVKKEDIHKLEDEISRLFRSNAFNMQSRLHADE